MAALQERNDSFRVLFRYQGKLRSFTIGEVGCDEAKAKAGQVDLLLLRLKQGLIELPPAVTIEEFLLRDGQVRKPEEARSAQRVTFKQFKEKYLETHRGGAMEENSLGTVTMHLGHFERTLGDGFILEDLSLADLQRHVNQRRLKKYRGRKLAPVTLKKEVSSFRAAWNWAAHMGLVKGSFPSRGLVYPKADEKPPFMTRQEIERKITSKMTKSQREELWACLYLTRPEMDELLVFVKEHASHGWVYPLFCFAAHTGVRRSEILRVLVSDVDLDSRTVLVREKKRSRKERTTRRVPLSPFLAGVLKDWLSQPPDGVYLFCHQDEVFRSKKRSKTTGYLNEKVRPSSLKGRMATVRRREKAELTALTKDEVHDHFNRVLAGGKWEVLKGLHTLRHSFISACASKGIDQRLIDEWTGHSTEEQRRRYRHLYPSTQQEAIGRVFD